MKSMTPVFILLLIAALIVGGCGKKEEPAASTGANTGGAAKTPDMATAFSMEIDLEKSVATLKEEAAKLSVDKLEAIAKKYKDALVEKEAELKKLTDKLSAIPMTEKLGSEAQELTGDIKTLTDTVSALQQRFQIYYDALKAKGGDLAGLTM